MAPYSEIKDMPIVDSSPVTTTTSTPSKRPRMSTKELTERKQAKAALRRALTVELAPGVKVYPDCYPGVGWVLDREGHAPRYLATKEKALQDYHSLVD
jgi:hypothetical protein